MNLFTRLERAIENAVEGLFGRGGGSVQPVEIARKLVRELEDHRRVSVGGRAFAPNVYTIWLAPKDLAELRAVQQALANELYEHLQRAAQERGFGFLGPLEVRLEEDTRLASGVVRVEAQFVQTEAEWSPGPPTTVSPGAPQGAAPTASDLGDTRFFRKSGSDAPPRQTILLLKVVEGPEVGRVIRVTAPTELGRSHDVHIRMNDYSVSRRHAAFDYDPKGWVVEDLGSTNGTEVNGERVTRCRLYTGDRLRVGNTLLEVRVESDT